jgi:hypothetical protein
MAEDFQRCNDSKSNIEQLVLQDISRHLRSMGKEIKKYGLPDLIVTDQFALVIDLINNLVLMFFFNLLNMLSAGCAKALYNMCRSICVVTNHYCINS